MVVRGSGRGVLRGPVIDVVLHARAVARVERRRLVRAVAARELGECVLRADACAGLGRVADDRAEAGAGEILVAGREAGEIDQRRPINTRASGRTQDEEVARSLSSLCRSQRAAELSPSSWLAGRSLSAIRRQLLSVARIRSSALTSCQPAPQARRSGPWQRRSMAHGSAAGRGSRARRGPSSPTCSFLQDASLSLSGRGESP